MHNLKGIIKTINQKVKRECNVAFYKRMVWDCLYFSNFLVKKCSRRSTNPQRQNKKDIKIQQTLNP